MEDKGIWVFDIECDSLLRDVTKIHCLCAINQDTNEVLQLTSYKEMISFFSKANVLVGHNIITYDIAVVEKLLGIKVSCKLVDTLPISWYIHSSDEVVKHGLEAWGEYYGVKKPKVDDWENLSVEEYVYRCTEDCRINTLLWKDQQSYLFSLYEDKNDILRLIEYLNFNMDLAREQESVGITLDIDKCKSSIVELEALLEPKIEALKEAMPKRPIYKTKAKPKNMYRRDGELTSLGEKWLDFLQEMNLGPSHEESVKFIDSYEDPNPQSTQQVKEWLDTLGWVPEHIKFVRDKKTNTFNQIPQIKHKTEEGDICDSIKKLYDVEPALENLASMSIIQSRVNVLKSFLDCEIDGKVYATMNGLTNTMRYKHSKPIVNLPKPSALYAGSIRECLIAGEGNTMVGADLSSIEDTTKMAYLYDYDPDYVKEQMVEGFDAHIMISVLAGLMSEDEGEFYKWYNSDGKYGTPSESLKSLSKEESKSLNSKLKTVRGKGKVVNFSATYKVGAKTLARNSGLVEKEAKRVLDVYWKKNKAILDFERDRERKTINGQLWVKNPVSKFWMSLRNEKDIFSTINQSTAVYVFTVWVGFVRQKGIKICLNIHDELASIFPEGQEDFVRSCISKAMEQTNNKLNLNLPIGCSMDFGKTYKEVH